MKLPIRCIAVSTVVICLAVVAGAQAAVWELKVVPNPGIEGKLRGVSCTSTSFCAAVGEYLNEITLVWGALGSEWNGSKWGEAALVANPGGEEGRNGKLQGVSCLSTTVCKAAGSYGSGKGGAIVKSLIESKTESGWKPVESPNPSNGKNPDFIGISCSTEASCLATGNFVNTELVEERGATFAAESEGGVWKRLSPVENPGNRKNGLLQGTSCIEEGVCIAAGAWGRESEGRQISQAGSEGWNKKENKWTAVEAEEPATAKFASFYGISCASAKFCMAVGRWSEAVSSGPYRALADVWNGIKWTVVLSSGGPPGATEGTLHGVSCVKEDCETVGDAKNSSGVEVSLAYHWKEKKWGFQSTENPAGAKASSLEGISCTAVEACNAVGGYVNSLGKLEPFAEIL